jgi:type I restriction enzyme S subunit
MKNIAKTALLALPIQFPTAEEQAAIAAVLCAMDANLSVHEARRDKARAIKQGMMQQLLTGRIRLVTSSRAAASA